MADEPSAPDAARREQLLDALAGLVERGGGSRLLAAPVVPGGAAFPDPWRPTPSGVSTLLRRLAWHAGMDRAIAIEDELRAALATERRPETHVELTEVRDKQLAFTLMHVGEDDIAGTLSHELGVAHAAIDRADPSSPYRAAQQPVIAIDPDHDLELGSIATVYLGLGVLAANAAYQQYSSAGRFNGAYSPLEYDVVRAGYVPMSELAYLLAVQATVRGETAPPRGLKPPQQDEVVAWLAVLCGRAPALRERLGIAADATGTTRARAVPFDDVAAEAAPESGASRTAFRWQSTRHVLGLFVGGAAGATVAAAISAASIAGSPAALIGCVLGAGLVGQSLGRRTRVARCSSCVTVVSPIAESCPRCGARFRGDISSLAQRLEAEERLDPRAESGLDSPDARADHDA